MGSTSSRSLYSGAGISHCLERWLGDGWCYWSGNKGKSDEQVSRFIYGLKMSCKWGEMFPFSPVRSQYVVFYVFTFSTRIQFVWKGKQIVWRLFCWDDPLCLRLACIRNIWYDLVDADISTYFQVSLPGKTIVKMNQRWTLIWKWFYFHRVTVVTFIFSFD